MHDASPVGPSVGNWQPPPLPDGTPLEGRYARLDRMIADSHASLLFRAFDGHDGLWSYMPDGPFASVAEFRRWMQEVTARDDAVFYVIRDLETGDYGGFASFMRMKPRAGSIEVGYIAFGPRLQRTRAATEAMYLMMRWAFEAGYRRYEWKCDALNGASRRAAQRLGLSFEGVFRQATVTKGRNRDTAWFAAIDKEWPALRQAFHLWLSPRNFDRHGRQKERLGDLTALVRSANDPEQAYGVP